MITVFTPSYNRRDELERLYNSLESQTVKSFEWLIVDDGSSDGTAKYIAELSEKATFKITYIYQENQGKPFAFNNGVLHATTPIFFGIDSDDWLTPDAIEQIIKKVTDTIDDTSVIGYFFQCLFEDGSRIATADFISDPWKGSYFEVTHRQGITGDSAIMFKLDILKEELFPKFEGENFVPEALLYNRLEKHGDFLFFNTPICYKEYLEDGFSANMHKLFKANPRGYYQYALEYLNEHNPKAFQTIRHIAAVGVFGKQNKIQVGESLKSIKKLHCKVLYILMLPAIFVYKI